MNFFVDTSHRSDEVEIMDDFSMKGEILRDTLDKLELINRLFGGNKVTIIGLKNLIKKVPKNKIITSIDLGCGHGDILRDIARFGKKNKYSFNLIGIDANNEAINYARELSKNHPEICFKMIDILSDDFEDQSYDVVLCTLFLHHFKNKELISFLKTTINKARIGIVVNDLHRHKLAYYLFKLIGVFVKNKTFKKDGLTSVLRAFKRRDLEYISSQIKVRFSIQWKWPFRYLWIMRKDLIN
jgi:2-polyprenyl-3-methyl-5-hydroxy-6-metoxy-1,4-benzoquinol methylase